MRDERDDAQMKQRLVRLRSVRKSDLEIIRDWRNSQDTREFNTQFTLLNMNNQRKWFVEISKKESPRKMFVITEKGGNPIGVCGLINIDKENRSADVAIILGEKKQRGRHLGSESLELLVSYGFKKLKLHRIGAEIFEYNKRSVNLFERLNFKFEATMRDRLWRDGKWWDVYSYSILSNDANQLLHAVL